MPRVREQTCTRLSKPAYHEVSGPVARRRGERRKGIRFPLSAYEREVLAVLATRWGLDQCKALRVALLDAAVSAGVVSATNGDVLLPLEDVS